MPVHDEPSGRPGGRARIALLSLATIVMLSLALLAGPLSRLPVFAAPLLQETPTPTPLPGTGSVTGIAWNDLDGDGARDPGEVPLAGVEVRSQNLSANTIVSGVTDAAGTYRLVGLAPAVQRVSATPPAGYALTTQASTDVVIVAGMVATVDFGARLLPTPTPTATTEPLLDVSNAQPVACGGVYSGNTSGLTNNVSAYSCRPWWDESGPEAVYRLELEASQPVTVTLVSASADLDLFLLRFALPTSCLTCGDSYLTYQGQPGV